MKAIIKITILSFCMAFFACNDSYLDLKPQDKLYDGNFWRNPDDLKLFCNNFYNLDWPGADILNNVFIYPLPWYHLQIMEDEGSDDMLSRNGINELASGLRVVPASGGGWAEGNWSNIRQYNVLLQQCKTVTGNKGLINHYIGVAKYFRALEYFKKVKQFGDVPWFSEPLNIDSKEIISQRRDPRALVMDSVLADLNFAAANCLPPTNANLEHGSVNVDVVNGFKSRICLFEGTYRKYRNMTGYEKFLQAAIDAAQIVMQSGRYKIWKGAGDPNQNYVQLFQQFDIYATGECIFGHEYDPVQGIYQCMSPLLRGENSVCYTMWFMRSYLNADGTPFHPDINQTFEEEITGRDPRLAQSVLTPGYIWVTEPGTQYGDTVTIASTIDNVNKQRGINRRYMSITGYQGIKGRSQTLEQNTFGNGSNGYIIMRYAEVLLNYAEAKAELNELSQADLDISINLLRDRVGMPAMSISPVHDPYSDWIVAGISTLPSDLIIEIRRERRVEMVAEALRRDDLMRWKAGKLLELPAIGVKYVPSDYKENNYPALALKLDVNIFVDENMRISPWKKTLPQGRKFDENKDYLWPIPIDVLAKSNGGIMQNSGW